jgi:hypothetical protein
LNRIGIVVSFFLLAVPLKLSAQQLGMNDDLAATISSASPVASDGGGLGASGQKQQAAMPRPFSRMALGVGISPMGVRLEAATNLDRYLNLTLIGNVFQYDVNNISSNGFTATANLNLASAGASLDYYPFPRHGFRLSPGVLFYNKNALSGTVTAEGGQSFTLNHINYISSATNPVTGTLGLGFHSQNPAFTITTGWGNTIPRSGGHLSFPFEIGVAVTGTPDVNLALTSGAVCNDEGQCQNVTTDAQLQSDLQAQIAKYKSDLNPLKVYPILSFGVAYSFKIR